MCVFLLLTSGIISLILSSRRTKETAIADKKKEGIERRKKRGMRRRRRREKRKGWTDGRNGKTCGSFCYWFSLLCLYVLFASFFPSLFLQVWLWETWWFNDLHTWTRSKREKTADNFGKNHLFRPTMARMVGRLDPLIRRTSYPEQSLQSTCQKEERQEMVWEGFLR